MSKTISDTLRKQKKHRKEARVLVDFNVGADGKISEVTVARRSAFPGYGFEEEAVRLIQNLPEFEPAISIDGQPIPSRLSVPIYFELNN